jgi:uncharacterized protein (TIGR03792 family)
VTYSYRYRHTERLPVEVLVFQMDPACVEEYLAVDHDVWTLGEAFLDGFDHIPFLSKEVWLDDSRPGEVTLVFVWESLESWMRVGGESIQKALQARFDERFSHPIELVRAPHEESRFGIHRWSRFERVEPPTREVRAQAPAPGSPQTPDP